jgi:hypothetical protein
MTNTKVIVLNTSLVSKATDIEQLVVLSFLRDIMRSQITIDQARIEVNAILSKYADNGEKVFDETMFTNN